ncbi:MAG: hypothetical protein ACRDI1_09225 [Actinomycetota bacterium]
MTRSSEIERILTDEPEAVADAVQALFGELVERLAALPVGTLEDVGPFVEAYRSLLGAMLRAIHEVEPHLVAIDGDRPVLVDSQGRASPVAVEVLQLSVLQAPFSTWVEKFGPGLGMALHLTSEIRTLLPGYQPIRMPREWMVFPHVEVSQDQFTRFSRNVWSELEGPGRPQLEVLMDSFELSKTEVARLFGVRRQAIDQWLKSGVPANRTEKLASVLAIADLLTNKLKTDRVPGVVRRPSGAFGGNSILECIAADRHLEVLDSLHETFDWAATA